MKEQFNLFIPASEPGPEAPGVPQSQWRRIHEWLHHRSGPPPVPVCSVCSEELLIKDIGPHHHHPHQSHAGTEGDMPALALTGAAEQSLDFPRRLEWGESEWHLRIRDAENGRLWGQLPHQGPSAAIVLFCGHLVCRACFISNGRIAGALVLQPPRPLCPTCTCFLDGGRCGHLLTHMLPAPDDDLQDGSTLCCRLPPTPVESLGFRPDRCWKCKNLSVVLAVEGRPFLYFRFGADLWKWRANLPPLGDADKRVMIFYRCPPEWTATEGVVRIARFLGRYRDCFVFDGIGRAHWGWDVDRTGFLHGERRRNGNMPHGQEGREG
ncbi:hypothetical protein N657DRAFT_674374 [Parathielavia appendiculata]|uniref:Uncharacterized protein n=1 Tax=Parathielavia appendiculata TaxID=2587402 RepID=A0AAN6TT57_9PEZI|nr:hypothetical protein N657DRAFT_674374 [Parathielavia appendiculata]